MRLTVGEILLWADDAKSDGAMVELPADVVDDLLGSFVLLHNAGADYEVGT